ncbi:MAG: acetylglutamate kinase [Nanoarchaeota archaeon]|nr:acetylglutamate kinase [Nanoarchaeota archaeon]
MEHLIREAHTFLEEALPYMQKFKGKIVVIKYGGNAMIDDVMKKSVMKDVALLKYLGLNPVIVHGGGPEITKEMEKRKIKPVFINGLRVTDEKIIKIIEKVFKQTNAEIRSGLKELKVETEEINNCVIAEQKDANLGLVGKVKDIETKKILSAIKRDKVPVISPLGKSEKNKGEKISKFNVNADTAATKIAIALKAEKLTFLTNVDAVVDKKNRTISRLTVNEAKELIKDGTIKGGMIPKIDACINAVESGCKKAHLINGTVPHALLFEIFTDKGVGTEVIK